MVIDDDVADAGDDHWIAKVRTGSSFPDPRSMPLDEGKLFLRLGTCL